MKTQTLKRFLLLFSVVLAVIFLGCTSIAVNSYLIRFTEFPNDFFQIKTNRYAINFYKSDMNEKIVSISPLDDYLYKGTKKYHLSQKENFSGLINSIYDPIWLIRSVIEAKDYKIWIYDDKKGFKAEYKLVISSDGKLKIVRRLLGRDPRVTFIGQSLIYCESCFIKDNNNRIFFSTKTEKADNIEFANNIGLTAYFIDNDKKLPKDIVNIIVIDSAGNEKVLIPFKNNEVYFNEKWKQLEFKEQIDKKGSVNQDLIFIN